MLLLLLQQTKTPLFSFGGSAVKHELIEMRSLLLDTVVAADTDSFADRGLFSCRQSINWHFAMKRTGNVGNIGDSWEKSG